MSIKVKAGVKVLLLTGFLFLILAAGAYGQTWISTNAPWTDDNYSANSMAVYGDYLYMGTGNSGGAQVWQYNGTAWISTNASWTTDNTDALSMAVYGTNLYVGTGNSTTGAEVWQYNGTSWTNVTSTLPWGAGYTDAPSMAVYGGNLYVGIGTELLVGLEVIGSARTRRHRSSLTEEEVIGPQVWQYNGTWNNVSPPWGTDNIDVPSMAVYGANLYVGTYNPSEAAAVAKNKGPHALQVTTGGAQVWQLSVQPTTIPTMTEWGMIILTVLLGAGSIYYLRRRRAAI